MNRLIISLISLFGLLLASCGDDDKEQEVYPIRFAHQDYTIRFGVRTGIDFVDGGGVYEFTASNPDVLGKIEIDSETHRLIIFPASIGESTLTIADINAGSSVTLRFVVEDFYLSFLVDGIEGKNDNPYLNGGGEIRFVRDEDNTKRLRVFRLNNLTHKQDEVADGAFDITRSGTNIFTLDMALHARPTEELEAFSYTIGGDSECLSLFEKYFEYDWSNSIASKSLPVKRLEMILTDPSGECRISCSLQPF